MGPASRRRVGGRHTSPPLPGGAQKWRCESGRVEKLAERDETQTEFYLWQLFHVHTEICEREETQVELKDELNEGEAAENDAESKLKDAKKKAATQRMQVAAAEKTRVKLSGALDALQPSTIKAKEEFKSFTKKMEKEEAELKKLNEQGYSHTDVVAEISTEIDEITEKEKKLEAEYQEVKEKGIGLTETLTPEQEAEYEKIRELAGIDSAPARSVLSKKVRNLENARVKASNVSDELKEISGRRDDAKKSTEELTVRKNLLSESLNKTATELKKAEKDLRSVEKHTQDVTDKREEIDTEIDEVNVQVSYFCQCVPTFYPRLGYRRHILTRTLTRTPQRHKMKY